MDKPVPDSLSYYGKIKSGAKVDGRFEASRPQTSHAAISSPGCGRRQDLLQSYGLPSNLQTTKILEGRWPLTPRVCKDGCDSLSKDKDDPFVTNGAMSSRMSPRSPKTPRGVRGVSPRLRIVRCIAIAFHLFVLWLISL